MEPERRWALVRHGSYYRHKAHPVNIKEMIMEEWESTLWNQRGVEYKTHNECVSPPHLKRQVGGGGSVARPLSPNTKASLGCDSTLCHRKTILLWLSAPRGLSCHGDHWLCIPWCRSICVRQTACMCPPCLCMHRQSIPCVFVWWACTCVGL